MKLVWHNIVQKAKSLDIYAVRGVAPRYRPGMKRFWWYGVFLATAGAFINSYVTLYALALGATSLQIGTLASLSSLMAMLAPIPGAQWAARWGKRKGVVVIAFGARHLMLLLSVFVPFLFTGPAAVSVFIGLMALRAGLLNLGSPAWSSLAGDLVPINRRGRYFSARKTVMALCALIFVPLAGQLINWMVDPLGYQVSFAISALVGLLAMYVYAHITEPQSKATVQQDRSLTAFWKALLDNRTFLLYTLFSMVFQFAWQMSGPYFGVYQVKVLGATPQIVGVISMAAAFMRMFGQQIGGRVIDRRGAKRALVVYLLIIPILPFIWLPMTQAWHVLFVAAPSGFLWAGRELANFNLQLELSDAQRRTQAIASYATLMSLANIIGPLVGGQIVMHLGYKWVFALSGIGRLIGALLLLSLLKPFAKKLAPA